MSVDATRSDSVNFLHRLGYNRSSLEHFSGKQHVYFHYYITAISQQYLSNLDSQIEFIWKLNTRK